MMADRSARGNPPLRILVLIDSLTLGGAENLIVAFARAAATQNLTVSVASIAGPDERNEIEPRLRALGVEPAFLSIPRLLSAPAVPRVVAAIRNSRCDVVHAHLEYAATLGPVAARVAHRPVVCTFHHVPEDTDRRAALRERLAVVVASRSARLIFVSRASMDAFAARYRRRSSWMVVRNGIDLSAFHPGVAPAPCDLGIPDGVPVVALVAALRPGKGHIVAMDAWREVLRELPEAMLLFAGSGELERDLRGYAARTGIERNVVFAGLRPDVPELLRASSLVILPSDTDAFPTVLMEAAASGRAVVATRVGGTSEIVADGETGILVPPSDATALARAITTLLKDDVRRRRMEAAARSLAERQFDEGTWIGELRAIYEDAIAQRPAPRSARAGHA